MKFSVPVVQLLTHLLIIYEKLNFLFLLYSYFFLFVVVNTCFLLSSRKFATIVFHILKYLQANMQSWFFLDFEKCTFYSFFSSFLDLSVSLCRFAFCSSNPYMAVRTVIYKATYKKENTDLSSVRASASPVVLTLLLILVL